ncbi:hypothetical protein CXB51_017019 [Gossypium anomalum]|uniref:Uncharacterized protein n=1 Tax=Gossypium anomalum TaxID=47600 RepID=A0A8J5Z531_9ROSI|nr:hypothetical protein CXB51_017019 [Gossypium anomalum]
MADTSFDVLLNSAWVVHYNIQFLEGSWWFCPAKCKMRLLFIGFHLPMGEQSSMWQVLLRRKKLDANLLIGTDPYINQLVRVHYAFVDRQGNVMAIALAIAGVRRPMC